jgi:hypothetical protein
MQTKMNYQKKENKIKKYTLTVLSIWITFIIISLVWNILNERKMVVELAKVEAEANYNKDIVYRQWASEHGGVYVPVTYRTVPNPYLQNIKERDIETPSGRKLTLINPAYMTRQVHELGKEKYGLR